MIVGRRLKREDTISLSYGGLLTPDFSIQDPSSPPAKREDSILSVSTSIGNPMDQTLSYNGYQTARSTDADYTTPIKEQTYRSESVSLRSSHIPLTATPFPAMGSIIPESGLQIVGRKVNTLIEAIEGLRKIGLQAIDTDLPELVLVGDQSAGKSSLMGAIAEISLPKSTGVCTKCPSNIKTSPATSWECRISLHEYYSYTDSKSKSQPFPNWKERDDGLLVRHFKTIYDKSDLEEVLKWAQIALLNPAVDFQYFIPGQDQREQSREEKSRNLFFSPNVVAVEISGPGLSALSFYDLPGIFQAAENRDQQYLVKVFEDLATKYIKRENALIICAITMGNDPGLSRTKAVITKLKAEKRCIGVLTMPDRMQSDSAHIDYDNILHGRSYYLPHGYFVTKQPGSDTKLNSSNPNYHALAREEESIFFDDDPLWSGEWKQFRERCGTGAIQEYLSQEFAKQIARCLPTISAKVAEETEIVDNQLEMLPNLQNVHVLQTVRKKLFDFSSRVQRFLNGEGETLFLSSWSELSMDFRDAIVQMKPMFICRDELDQKLPEIINIDDEDETQSQSSVVPAEGSLSSSGQPPAKRARTQNSPPQNGIITQRLPRAEEQAAVLNAQHRGRPMGTPQRATAFDRLLGAGKNFLTIKEIRNIIQEHNRPGLPDHVDGKAKEQICLQAVALWEAPLEVFMKESFDSLNKAVLRSLAASIGDFQSTELYRASKHHILQLLEELEKSQTAILVELFNLEMYRLFTINTTAFLTYRAEELFLLERARKSFRTRCYVENQHRMSNREPMTLEQRRIKERLVKEEQLGPDPFHNEIQLAAYVRGYYKTAGLRFADNVSQSMQGTLFRKLSDRIVLKLESDLGLDNGDGEAICQRLTAENPDEARQRSALLQQRAQLAQASHRLYQLGAQYAADDDEEPFLSPEDAMGEEMEI